LQSDEPASEGSAEVIHHGHDQIDREEQGEETVLQEKSDGDLDLLAESPGSESEVEDDSDARLYLGHQSVRQGTDLLCRKDSLATAINWPRRRSLSCAIPPCPFFMRSLRMPGF